MQDLDVIIKIQNGKMWMQYKNEWVPLNHKLMEGFGFSLKDIIVLKLIELEDHS